MASKYYQTGHRLLASPYASLSPPTTDFASAMSRSSSHDSTSSVSHYQFDTLPAYTSAPMMRSSSTPTQHSSVAMRRSSSSSSTSNAAWLTSPYRSCLNACADEPSSYISNDDLMICPSLPVQSIPNPERQVLRREMTTEEQIAHVRLLQEQEQEEHHQQQQLLPPPPQLSRRLSSMHSSKKQVRFDVSSPKGRRSVQPKRRPAPPRRSSSSLNGPM